MANKFHVDTWKAAHISSKKKSFGKSAWLTLMPSLILAQSWHGYSTTTICCFHLTGGGGHEDIHSCKIHMPASTVHALSSSHLALRGLDDLALQRLQLAWWRNQMGGLGWLRNLFSSQPEPGISRNQKLRLQWLTKLWGKFNYSMMQYKTKIKEKYQR